MECLSKALSIEPQMPEAHFNLGRELFESGQHEEALRHMEACRAANHGEPWGNAKVFLRTLAPADGGEHDTTTLHKLRHDLEQLDFLRNRKKLDSGFAPVIDAYRELVSRFDGQGADDAPTVLDESVPGHVKTTYNRPAFIPHCPALSGPAINPTLDCDAIESDNFGSTPSVIHIDDLLTREAL